ncbi:MAG: MOSC domain-containing protein [Pseudomonadota bacterium]
MADRPSLSTRIDGLFLGAVEHRWDGKDPSAIGKQPVTGPQQVGVVGFVNDAQADLVNHGGQDKAIHHYPSDHYLSWIAEGQIPNGTKPAAFGENIASVGMTEDDVCIGDILQLGNALVQISQGRQPCWKVSAFTDNAKMAYLFQKTGRTGWYYRVLETGQVSPGDLITLKDRRQPEWTVRRVTNARLTRKVSKEDAATLAVMPELAEGWRAAFARMAGGDRDEDVSRRLGTS